MATAVEAEEQVEADNATPGRRRAIRGAIWITMLAAALLVSIPIAVGLGPVPIPAGTVARIIGQHLLDLGGTKGVDWTAAPRSCRVRPVAEWRAGPIADEEQVAAGAPKPPAPMPAPVPPSPRNEHHAAATVTGGVTGASPSRASDVLCSRERGILGCSREGGWKRRGISSLTGSKAVR
jgi:hypothetical protein